MSRIKHDVEKLDYQETKRYFENRAKNKYKADNPYSVIMHQDQNPELVAKRNQQEVQKLSPLLKFDKNSRILDLACGIGRWSDAVPCEITEYCGIDFSEGLIDIANQRNTRPEAAFYTGDLNDLESILSTHGKGKYNRVIMMGILLYLNDADILNILGQAEKRCEEHALFCIRVPIGLDDRLTLKDHFSDELEDNYNAIYRTDKEMKQILVQTLSVHGFSITHEGFLYDDDSLNIRKETAQYFYILER